MQIRCYRCGWSFAIKKEEAAFALQALEETGGTHYDSNCPRCRHSNRISLEQLKKASPPTDVEPAATEQEDTGEVAMTDEEREAGLKAEQELEPDRELETEATNPETSGKEAQAEPEETAPKKRRRKRG